MSSEQKTARCAAGNLVSIFALRGIRRGYPRTRTNHRLTRITRIRPRNKTADRKICYLLSAVSYLRKSAFIRGLPPVIVALPNGRASDTQSKLKLRSQTHAAITLRGAGPKCELAHAGKRVRSSEQGRTQIANRRSLVRVIQKIRDEQTNC